MCTVRILTVQLYQSTLPLSTNIPIVSSGRDEHRWVIPKIMKGISDTTGAEPTLIF